MLRRGGDIDVRSADPEKFAADSLMREFRTVAVAAQVTEIKMFEVRGDNFAGELCGGVVGEMAVPADDALLDAPWAARIILQHFQIMIRFQHEHVGAADAFHDEFRRVSEVREKTDVCAVGAKKKANRIVGVVRHVKRINDDGAQIETSARFKQAELGIDPELRSNGVARLAITVNREFQFGSQSREPLDVIGMFVRDENAIKAFGRASNGQQALPNLAAAQARIDQQARVIALEISAVPAGTAAEDGELHWHDVTLGDNERSPQT